MIRLVLAFVSLAIAVCGVIIFMPFRLGGNPDRSSGHACSN